MLCLLCGILLGLGLSLVGPTKSRTFARNTVLGLRRKVIDEVDHRILHPLSVVSH
jgi:hypothetical protein